MASQKENDNTPATKLRGPQYCDLTDKEFKIAGLKNSISLQGNSERQFDELRNKIKEQKEFFTKEIEIFIKNQTEILELNHAINEMNALESLGRTGWKKE